VRRLSFAQWDLLSLPKLLLPVRWSVQCTLDFIRIFADLFACDIDGDYYHGRLKYTAMVYVIITLMGGIVVWWWCFPHASRQLLLQAPQRPKSRYLWVGLEV